MRSTSGISGNGGFLMSKTTASAAVEREAFTIPDFVEAYRISRALLYLLWRHGDGPRRMRVRGRVLISRAAAEQWRDEQEAKSAGGDK